MGAAGVIAIVFGILLLVALIQAAIWIPLVARWRRRSAEYWAAFDAGLVAGEERVLSGELEKAVYRGGTEGYSKVKGNGRMVLTDRRLLFRKLTGGVIEVPVADMAGARRQRVFLASAVGRQEHLVIHTKAGADVGFFVGDIDAWLARIDAITAPNVR